MNLDLYASWISRVVKDLTRKLVEKGLTFYFDNSVELSKRLREKFIYTKDRKGVLLLSNHHSPEHIATVFTKQKDTIRHYKRN